MPEDNKNRYEAINLSFKSYLKEIETDLENEVLQLESFDSNYINKLQRALELLKVNKFTSVDDLTSVLYLYELDNFFKENTIKCIFFVDFKELIPRTILNYAEIEIRLDEIDHKVSNLLEKDYRIYDKYIKFISNMEEIREINKQHFIDKLFNIEEYKHKVLDLITKNKELFKEHSVISKLLVNLITFIFSFGTAFIVNKAVTGNFFFYKKNALEMKMDEIQQHIRFNCT